MNIERFQYPDDEFPLLNLTAWLDFKTQASISFELGVVGHPDSGGAYLPIGSYRFGRLYVFHLPEEFIKYRIHVFLPSERTNRAEFKPMISAIFAALEIAHDETYVALFSLTEKTYRLDQHRDREGFTDGIYD